MPDDQNPTVREKQAKRGGAENDNEQKLLPGNIRINAKEQKFLPCRNGGNLLQGGEGQ